MFADVRLQNFRSYDDASFEFSPSVNIIVGPNASGKTNLLEAILFLCAGRSYRVKDLDLINFGNEWSRVDGLLDDSSTRVIKLFKSQSPSKLYVFDDKEYVRLNLDNSLPVVLFEPSHMQLLNGSPERRRDYLDGLLEQTTPQYKKLMSQYKRALAQRNTLLKNTGDYTQIFPWNIRLSQLGGQIAKQRQGLVNNIDSQLGQIYSSISKTDKKVNIRYESSLGLLSYETNLLKSLEANFKEDSLRGFTNTGPHRDDIKILFDDRSLQDVASRGESRTAILCLKILEIKLLEKYRGRKPVVLLDDVFSELDSSRRNSLTEYLKHYQIFITTTDADLVVEHFTRKSNVIALTSD